jgi:hypothetical protein
MLARSDLAVELILAKAMKLAVSNRDGHFAS